MKSLVLLLIAISFVYCSTICTKGSCTFDSQCYPTEYAVCCNGTCASGRFGDPCDTSVNRSCCKQPWTCQANGKCGFSSPYCACNNDYNCAISLKCKNSVCTPPGVGESCNTNLGCDIRATPNLYCVYNGSYFCAIKGGVGATCNDESQCLSQFACNLTSSKCVDAPTIGQYCENMHNDRCAFGLTCNKTGYCITSFSQANGTECDGPTQCASNLCENDGVSPTRVCVAKKYLVGGSLCEYDYECKYDDCSCSLFNASVCVERRCVDLFSLNEGVNSTSFSQFACKPPLVNIGNACRRPLSLGPGQNCSVSPILCTNDTQCSSAGICVPTLGFPCTTTGDCAWNQACLCDASGNLTCQRDDAAFASKVNILDSFYCTGDLYGKIAEPDFPAVCLDNLYNEDYAMCQKYIADLYCCTNCGISDIESAPSSEVQPIAGFYIDCAARTFGRINETAPRCNYKQSVMNCPANGLPITATDQSSASHLSAAEMILLASLGLLIL